MNDNYEEEDFLFAAEIGFCGDDLEVFFNGTTISIENLSYEDQDHIQEILKDANFWTAFLGGLGAALATKKQQMKSE